MHLRSLSSVATLFLVWHLLAISESVERAPESYDELVVSTLCKSEPLPQRNKLSIE